MDPVEFSAWLAITIRQARKTAVAAETDKDEAYWRGYVDALEHVLVKLTGQ